MKVVVGFDHAGFPLKETVLDAVRNAGHEPIDVGASSVDPFDDYPDFSEKVGPRDSKRRSRAWNPLLWLGRWRMYCGEQNERHLCLDLS